jgi:hypothetical protein
VNAPELYRKLAEIDAKLVELKPLQDRYLTVRDEWMAKHEEIRHEVREIKREAQQLLGTQFDSEQCDSAQIAEIMQLFVERFEMRLWHMPALDKPRGH